MTNSNKLLKALPPKKAADDSRSIVVIEVRNVCRFHAVIKLDIKGITKIAGTLIATLFLPKVLFWLELLLDIIFEVISKVNMPNS